MHLILFKLLLDLFLTCTSTAERPENPIVLAHGLLGFDELRFAGNFLPGVQYWRGIKEALEVKGVQVITASVPPSASIETRAEELERDIRNGLREVHGIENGGKVNIIAHSMVCSALCLDIWGVVVMEPHEDPAY